MNAKPSRLQTEIDWARPWHDWIDRVTQDVFELPARKTAAADKPAEDVCRVFQIQKITGMGQIVPNCNTKTSHLVSPFLVRTEMKAWDAFFDLFLDAFQASEEPPVFDRNLYGLGFLGMELLPDAPFPELTFIDLCDLLWDHRYRIDRSPTYWRRCHWSRQEFQDWLDANHANDRLPPDKEQFEVWLEYGKKEWRLLTLETDAQGIDQTFNEKVWHTWPNPCVYENFRGCPVWPLIGLYPLKVDVPLGDYVLCRAADLLLSQMEAGMIESTKHGLGFLFLDEDAIDNIENITGTPDNPIANPVVGYHGQGQGRPPFYQATTLSLPAETLQLIEKKERDLGKASGVTDYEQGSLPNEPPKYAIQVSQQVAGSANRATRDLNEHNATRKSYLKTFAAWVLSIYSKEKEFESEPASDGSPQPPVKGVLQFMSGGKSWVLPKRLPLSYSIQDQSAKMADQTKAITKAKLFEASFAQMAVNPKALATQVLSNLGDSQEDIEDLLEAPQPILPAPGTSAIPGALPQAQPTGTPDLGALLGALGNDGGQVG